MLNHLKLKLRNFSGKQHDFAKCNRPTDQQTQTADLIYIGHIIFLLYMYIYFYFQMLSQLTENKTMITVRLTLTSVSSPGIDGIEV